MIKKFHILIAEDDSMTRTLLSNYFLEKGYEVFSAENGLEGLRILEDQEVDLVITDYTMPLMGGMEFILHTKKTHPRLPVILVSGYGLKENKGFQSIRNVLCDYFEKPVNLKLLYAAIKKIQQEILDE